MSNLKRVLLTIITLVVVSLLGVSLVGSLGEPQIGDRLELYQTDLVLQATEYQPDAASGIDPSALRKNLLGENPLKSALEEYQATRKSTETSLEQFRSRLASQPASQAEEVRLAIQQQESLLDQLDLRIGLLQAKQNQVPAALETWKTLLDRPIQRADSKPIRDTATVLSNLWSDPPQLLPDAEANIQRNLEGWFRQQALTQLYTLQQRNEALVPLQAESQAIAEETLLKLGIVGALPTLGGIIGIILLITLGVRTWLRRNQPRDGTLAWNVPWTGETVWQVLIVGFFFSGQIALPVLLRLLGIDFSGFGGRAQAVTTLVYYLLMAGTALTVLYLSIRRFFPLPEDWFRLTGKRSGLLWGVGGYFAALPLMLIVSVMNQQIWQGQGGSNPLLKIVLEEGDPIALSLFFVTAAIAAPVFEEIMFRGFLLPSLTRYFPVWGAIALSSLIFATAHLSLSEIIPLSVLGAILGFVYTRSRGLLSCMLLHSLWNSVTMIGLFVLGSGID
ncbi:MAG: CPBP family intramembrane metalloprotease [Oculatellaceae cyanobacterium Prado106]|nr:CPBP family intramembrane metalloprotease [Oculatellaceae cyanobacterium Prado106]